MYIYILLYAIIYIFAVLDLTDYKKSKFIWFAFLLGLCTLFAGLRYNIGADYLGYYSYFNKASINLFGGLEVGFEVLAVFIREIFGSYELFVFVLVTLTFIFIYYSIKSISTLYFIPLYVYAVQYLLGGPMGQMRQALAIAILLFSVKYIINKNFKKYLFFVLMATSFHVTSFVFIIAYIFNHIKLNKIVMLLLLLVAILVGETSIPSILLINLTSLFPGELFNTLSLYIESEDYGEAYSGSIFAYVERLLVFIISLLFYRKREKNIKILLQIYWLSLLIFFFFSDISILAQRISRPFKAVDIFIYSYLLYTFTNNKHLKVIGFILFSLLLYKPIYMIISRPGQYIPYLSILGN